MGTGKRAPTILGVPMLKADEQPFSGKQIALLENFAGQAGDRDREHAPLNELRESLQHDMSS